MSHSEGYDSMANISLSAVTKTNVPEPFSEPTDRALSPLATAPGTAEEQQIKFRSSDLQETLYPNGWFSHPHLCLVNN